MKQIFTTTALVPSSWHRTTEGSWFSCDAFGYINRCTICRPSRFGSLQQLLYATFRIFLLHASKFSTATAHLSKRFNGYLRNNMRLCNNKVCAMQRSKSSVSEKVLKKYKYIFIFPRRALTSIEKNFWFLTC